MTNGTMFDKVERAGKWVVGAFSFGLAIWMASQIALDRLVLGFSPLSYSFRYENWKDSPPADLQVIMYSTLAVVALWFTAAALRKPQALIAASVALVFAAIPSVFTYMLAAVTGPIGAIVAFYFLLTESQAEKSVIRAILVPVPFLVFVCGLPTFLVRM